MSIISINPANGKLIKSYKEDSEKQVSGKIEKAHTAWLKWRNTSFSTRAELLKNAAALLLTRKLELATLMAKEMGKPLPAGIAEIEKCAAVCDYYAANGAEFLKDEAIKTKASKSYVSFQPLGVVLAVMPWNFPFWQLFRFLAPALMAGNGGLLKHASNVTGCAVAIEKLITAAGFPKDIFKVLVISSKFVKQVIAHPLVKAVTLTGSTEAGKQVAQQAGYYLKKTVLELGGSDPYLVLADADLEQAAEICMQSRLINNGQSCIAAKRFILVKEIEKEFTRIFLKKMQSKVTGDPFDAHTDLGPMARTDLRDELHQQVKNNIEAGAKCLLGGKIPDFKGKHAYYTPTVLSGIRKGMPGYEEEIFGPVALILSAKNEEEAIRIANDSPFGLGAAIFTANVKHGEELAAKSLNAGSCFVNSLVKSDPRLPFGGINQSGYGRELSAFGIREFVNIKTVYVK
ncbi:succinate-semialdehyde dehydrogenase / glutarate-semialdehyde dehydrogenase [Pedobacter steynii]|uniref:Succinate-semialdehyde dehydrogenase / glutarate-semialdehyde dehydrogenase n=1 Tax=Pedobacter steynii TaxID=430522 RepID=A0A1H0J9I5_9SPHI|nr:NAD-dependent succinate-semialdehyde dehydrogenase [Pedobacter steynii]NQX43067.1 NAD-dependent succinate-semialdehyde dehydrogenase [Pedobacter steynii]SDO40139.1 succinate-semialdehyde dehydrogenase / glutarate-semialdehyde dehydrogenase [Pedobacter steynii]